MRYARPIWAAFLSLGLLSATGAGVVRAAPTSGDATHIDMRVPGAAVTFAGRITHAADGSPVTHALVEVYDPVTQYPVRWQQTDASGQFQVRGLEYGPYLIGVNLPVGGPPLGWYSRGAPGNFVAFGTRPKAVTYSGVAIRGIHMALPPTFTVSGRVTRADGSAIKAWMPLELQRVTRMGIVVAALVAYADQDGRYRIGDVLPGLYRLRVDESYNNDKSRANLQAGCLLRGAPGNFTADCTKGSSVRVASKDVHLETVGVPRGIVLTGRLARRTGEAVCAYVTVLGRSTEDLYEWLCGTFRLAGLSTGTYRLQVRPLFGNLLAGWYSRSGPYHWVPTLDEATAIRVTADADLGTITPDDGYTISGVITDARGDTPPIRVDAVDSRGMSVTETTTPQGGDGEFTLEGLPLGSYRLRVQSEDTDRWPGMPGWYSATAPNGFTADPAAASIVTARGDRTGIRIRQPDGFTISGNVHVDTVGYRCFCTVQVFDAATGEIVTGGSDFHAVYDDETYTVRGLAPGRYLVQVDPGESGTTGWYRAGATGHFTPSRQRATPVTVGP